MTDWLSRVSVASGLPSEFFIFCLIAFSFLILLVFGLFYCLFELKKTRDISSQTIMSARLAWREDLGAAVSQSKDLIAERIKPDFLESERNIERSVQDLSKMIRTETFSGLKAVQDTLNQSLLRNDEQVRGLNQRFQSLSETLNASLADLKKQVDSDLRELNKDNEAKLEKIRETVEEKLQHTLTEKVGESFSQVTRQLNLVYEGLGQMKDLAEEVGGLKRVFVNVKSRGMLGEVQLEALLKEYFTETQYVKNAHTVPSKPKMVVEFAVKLPGISGNSCLLPIDAKFPIEDYQRLLKAGDEGDRDGVAEARNKLRLRLRNEAKSISEYINVPETTDFAIMFLPSEGLYAEALSLEGLSREMFTNYRVYVMGPSTLASALCAYRAGFQTFAIERKSSEIRKILASVQTEFSKYGEVLNKLKLQVEGVAKTVDLVQNKTRRMNLQLEVASENEGEEVREVVGPVSTQQITVNENKDVSKPDASWQ